MRNFLKGVGKFLGGVALFLLIVGGILYAFFVRVVDVGHNAMAPTTVLGDQVLVWRNADLELGDIALCPHPNETGRYVMGRIVGLPGHRVSMDRGMLYINGETPDRDLHPPITFVDLETGRQETMVWGRQKLLDHDHLFFYRQRQTPHMRERRVTGGVYLLSDNWTYQGEDSRTFGEVSRLSCIGQVFMRLTAGESPEEIGNGPLDILE